MLCLRKEVAIKSSFYKVYNIPSEISKNISNKLSLLWLCPERIKTTVHFLVIYRNSRQQVFL